MTQPSPDLQNACERGQELLMATKYLEAENVLSRAEELAWESKDFDTLARLYMPLQEARRQRRQRCGEGVVCLDLISNGPDDRIDGLRVLQHYPHGQLLVGGWKTLEPAVTFRKWQAQHGLYVDTFLAAVFPMGSGRVVVIVPEDAKLPQDDPKSVDELIARCPPHSIVISEKELPTGSRKGSPQTFGEVMSIWERLHQPFLAAADMQVDPVMKIEAYRRAIRVDYACELAHQKLSDVARQMTRGRKP